MTLGPPGPAEELAKGGWPVLPLLSKVAIEGGHGLLDATTDLNEIDAFAERGRVEAVS